MNLFLSKLARDLMGLFQGKSPVAPTPTEEDAVISKIKEIIAPFDPQLLIEARDRIGGITEQWMIDDARACHKIWQREQIPAILLEMRRILRESRDSLDTMKLEALKEITDRIDSLLQ